MKEIAGKKVILTEGEFLRREEANKRYLMKLETPYLLRSYLHEAGRYSGRGPDAEAFGGWEDLSCQLRGHSWDIGCRQRRCIIRKRKM